MDHFSDTEFVHFGSNDDPNSLQEPRKLQFRTERYGYDHGIG